MIIVNELFVRQGQAITHTTIFNNTHNLPLD